MTAELEMAEPRTFKAKDATPFGKEGFLKKANSAGYETVVDTHGKLLWPNGKTVFDYYKRTVTQRVSAVSGRKKYFLNCLRKQRG